jgi:hypothetical protein
LADTNIGNIYINIQKLNKTDLTKDVHAPRTSDFWEWVTEIKWLYVYFPSSLSVHQCCSPKIDHFDVTQLWHLTASFNNRHKKDVF